MKTGKKLLSLVLAILVVFSVFSISFVSWSSAESEGKKITEYNKDDIIEFGYYPQGKVDDERIILQLNYLAGDNTTWNSYNYYSGTGKYDDGQMISSDYMRYTDVIYNGYEYRGVVFDNYRPYYTGYTSSADYSYQDNNGYNINNVYWFKFEPIQWRVLDPSIGLIICETIIDSQAYNNYVLYSKENNEYWGNAEETYYPNNYENSDIRAWLNDDFYNTAFSIQQQNIIQCTELDNKAYRADYSVYDSATTNDKIFLLSYDEANNTNYFSQDIDRLTKGTDYAKCQGLRAYSSNVSTYNGCSYWYLRSAGFSSKYTCSSPGDGNFLNYSYDVFETMAGIRPALTLSLDKENIQTKRISYYNKDDIIEFGYYPQGKVDDEAITEELNNLAGDNTTWISYNYYSGTGSWCDGQMISSNYMRYIDILYNGNKYRGVVFDSYRPRYTGYTSSFDFQQTNDYTTNTIYWFKYESIQWRVLDPSTGLVICETIIDSQAYNNYTLSFGKDVYDYTAFWGDPEQTYYVNNYEKSDIRKWLNDDFYNTAFSEEQQNIIQCTELDNKAYMSSKSAYDSATTNDKVFLLSYAEANNSNYFMSNTNRQAKGSDYAKCQGLYVESSSSYSDYSYWRLRSAGYASYNTCYVYVNGGVRSSSESYHTKEGVRPALKLDLESDVFQSSTEELLHKHIYDEGAVIDPTCEDDGYTTYTCTICGELYKDNYTDAIGHKVVTDNAVASTCTTTGLTEGKHCDACGTVFVAQTVIDMVEHTPVVDEAVEATCTATGLTEGKHCDACGTVFVAQTVVDMLEHTPVVDNAVAPTCTATGLTEGKHCNVCNTVIVAQEEVPALGHKDTNKDGVCDTCKVVINEELNKKYLVSKATINVPNGKTVDYRNKIKLTATATNVPNGYYVQIFEGTKAVGEKGAATATYTSGELKAGVTYTVKIVDAKGNVVSSDAQNKTVKVDVNAGFFKKIIAFFKGLFGTLPTINL